MLLAGYCAERTGGQCGISSLPAGSLRWIKALPSARSIIPPTKGEGIRCQGSPRPNSYAVPIPVRRHPARIPTCHSSFIQGEERAHARSRFVCRIRALLHVHRVPAAIRSAVIRSWFRSRGRKRPSLWDSYIVAVFSPSNSYGVRVQSPGAMKRSLRLSRRTRDLDLRRIARRRQSPTMEPQATSAFPQPGEVLGEIGLILAVHLAVALAVTLTLRALDIG